jgi:hypothetical protein
MVSGQRFCLELATWRHEIFLRCLPVVKYRLVQLFPAALYAAQFLIVPGIVVSSRKFPGENREKMKESTVIGIDGSWNHRRNGSADILNSVDVESRRVVSFEIGHRVNASEQGSQQGASNGVETEAVSWMMERWEDDQKVAVGVANQESEMAKTSGESR